MSSVGIGRIVHYVLSVEDSTKINKRRRDAQARFYPHLIEDGAQIHYGNDTRPGDILPMIVTAVWPDDLVSGQVFLDGNDTFWAQSIHPMPEEETNTMGYWMWPPRTK